MVPSAEVTVDHVIARSWYPVGTPAIAKWKVPACNVCNNRYSAIEQDILCRLAFCINPADRSVEPIVQRALRSIDPKEGKSARDIKYRFNKRQAILEDLKNIPNPRGTGVLPSFRDNFFEGSRTGIRVPAGLLKVVVEKWIRGIHFSEFKQPVGVEHEVTVYFVEDEVAETALTEIMRYAIRIQKGPGVEVLIWHVTESDGSASLYAFNIWQRFRAYGSVTVGRDS